MHHSSYSSSCKHPITRSLAHRKASKRLYVYPMKGRLISAARSSPACAVWARSAALVSFWSISSMGKYCVSTLDCSLGSKGARIRRSPSHCTPRKKGCCLISCAPWAPPWRPRRCSASQINLIKSALYTRSNNWSYRRTKSSASAPSCWSGGKCRLRGQSTILRYVSCGSSAQNGGQPIKHSNMIVPTDHQSQPKS